MDYNERYMPYLRLISLELISIILPILLDSLSLPISTQISVSICEQITENIWDVYRCKPINNCMFLLRLQQINS